MGIIERTFGLLFKQRDNLLDTNQILFSSTHMSLELKILRLFIGVLALDYLCGASLRCTVIKLFISTKLAIFIVVDEDPNHLKLSHHIV